jgi:hypothetical protein
MFSIEKFRLVALLQGVVLKDGESSTNQTVKSKRGKQTFGTVCEVAIEQHSPRTAKANRSDFIV